MQEVPGAIRDARSKGRLRVLSTAESDDAENVSPTIRHYVQARRIPSPAGSLKDEASSGRTSLQARSCCMLHALACAQGQPVY